MDISKTCADCSVRNRSLCGTLDDGELQALSRIGHRRHFTRGATILWSGEPATQCGNLLSGALKMTASTADGREQTVSTLYPADFVGRPYAEDSRFTVTATADSELCMFARAPFEHLLERHAKMERQLLDQAFTALDESRAQMLTLARRSAAEKVAGFLLDMADRAEVTRISPTGPATFDLPINRGQIADLLGLTIETVSRQLTKLKLAGIIALPGIRTITIRDEASLRTRAG
ncbi:Crp/Fnr family transcriptional regulator [Sphingomonas sp.]|uniref:Crp/Fnr family transcriptional regulator n=1 Tax=Sphingomonas sp. TaxID=28214 RepID=UPI003B3B904E